MLRIFSVLALILSSATAGATVIDCGRLLDPASGRWQDRVRISIEGGRVQSVGAQTGAVPAGVTDLNAYSCLPGLIDMHTHLSQETRPEAEELRGRMSENPAEAALRSSGYAERTLRAGFTTVRDLGARDGVDLALRRAIASGWIQGPRMFVAGQSIATSGGHADASNFLNRKFLDALGTPGPEAGVVNSAHEARRAVRLHYQAGTDLIKITATGGVLSLAANSQNPQFFDDELKAIVDTARDYGMRVAAHAHGAEGIKRALRAGVDSIEHGAYMDDEAIELFRKSKAWFVPTISAGKFVAAQAELPGYYAPIVLPKARAVGPLMQKTFERAWKAGVRIAFGTDAGVFPHGQNAGEFIYMVEAGMPPIEAIRAATINAAELLGKATELGRVAPGYYADLVAVEGDPAQDIRAIRNVRAVVKDGVVVR